jgi:hypothetical protein
MSSGVDPVVDVEELAKMLHKDPESVRRMKRERRLPEPVPNVRKMLWSRNVIEAWMKAGCPDLETFQRHNNVIVSLVYD